MKRTKPLPAKPRTLLLKVGGEALGPEKGRGLDPDALRRIGAEVARLHEQGLRLGIVVGGGNFLRGREAQFLDRISADHIGILATVLNGLALQAALEEHAVRCLVQSAVSAAFTEPIHPRRARQALSQGTVVLFVGGTGNPLVSTDTAAAIRAVEIGADLLLKGSYIDGVYDKDPKLNVNAKRFARLSFEQVIEKRLKVMDLAAFEICSRHHIPILVFDIRVPDNLVKVVKQPRLGTLVA